MKEIIIKPEGIFDVDLDAYGRVVCKTTGQNPDNSGDGWRCWYPIGWLENQTSLQIGLVLADLDTPEIKKVEAHPTREEWVYAIDAPIIQLIALSTKKSGDLADPETAKAILLNPGEGIVIKSGIWHAPAFGANLSPTYYGFVLAKSNPDIKELGLVPFLNEYILHIDLRL